MLPQDQLATAELRPAPKINKEDCRVDWTKSQTAVYNHIRGFAPYPAAYTMLVDAEGAETACKIFTASKLPTSDLRPGQIATDSKRFLHIGTASGDIALLDVQLAGKKRMPADALLRGFAIDSHWKVC